MYIGEVSSGIVRFTFRYFLRALRHSPLRVLPASSAQIRLEVWHIPNQELSVLYGGPTLNYGEQLSLYVPKMLRVSMTEDLAHLQLSDLQGETRPIYRTSDLQGERMLICRT